MDEYRQSLAGRALADVLQELEGSGAIDAQAGDTLFDLFDAAVCEEFHQSKQQIDDANGDDDEVEAQETPLPPVLFTHTSLELRARVESYNRYMDKWSVAAALNDSNNSVLLLDKASVKLPPAASRMLIKLHRPPPSMARAGDL